MLKKAGIPITLLVLPLVLLGLIVYGLLTGERYKFVRSSTPSLQEIWI